MLAAFENHYSVPNLNRDEISYNQLQEMALFFYGVLGVKIVLGVEKGQEVDSSV